jgi:hypothetical protein
MLPKLKLPAAHVQQTKLEELTGRRKPLFAQLEKNPNETQIAIEIKVIDDQIAECNLHIQADRKRRK